MDGEWLRKQYPNQKVGIIWVDEDRPAATLRVTTSDNDSDVVGDTDTAEESKCVGYLFDVSKEDDDFDDNELDDSSTGTKKEIVGELLNAAEEQGYRHVAIELLGEKDEIRHILELARN